MSQVIVDAFVSTVNHVVEMCLGNIDWQHGIRQIHELLTKEDHTRLHQYCKDKNSLFRHKEDYRLYED